MVGHSQACLSGIHLLLLYSFSWQACAVLCCVLCGWTPVPIYYCQVLQFVSVRCYSQIQPLGCHGLTWGGMDPGLPWTSDGPCCCDTACRGLAMCYSCGCGGLLWSDHVVGVGTFRGVWCPTNTCGLAACPDLLVLRVAGFRGGGRPR